MASSFRDSFRLNKEAFLYVTRTIESALEPSSIPVVLQVAAVLRFLGEGSYQRSVGKDFDIGLGRSTVSKILTRILNAMERKLCPMWIKLAMSQEKVQESKRFFFEKYGIPGVIGCVDGTHIKIRKPHEDSSLFYNRKGYYSMNALVVSSLILYNRFLS